MLLIFFIGAAALIGIGALMFALIRDARQNELQKREPFHYCDRCGYDLTGATSGACPECGKTLPFRHCEQCGRLLFKKTTCAYCNPLYDGEHEPAVSHVH